MTEFALIKSAGVYVPATDQDVELSLRHKSGDVIRCDFKKMRNPAFHRKFFALLNIGYEAWEPQPINNKFGAVEKNFEQFREDITILAGYYEQHVRLDGSIRFVAKSISFGSMQEYEFEKLYNSVANVLLSKVLKNYKGREELDGIIDQILGFC